MGYVVFPGYLKYCLFSLRRVCVHACVRACVRIGHTEMCEGGFALELLVDLLFALSGIFLGNFPREEGDEIKEKKCMGWEASHYSNGS